MEPESAVTVAKVSAKMLPQLAAFLGVVEAGSFTAAGRRASVDKTVLSRRVTALEEALGVRLLNRSTRRLHVTEAGRRLVEDADSSIADALAALARTASPEHVEGVVRVASAPDLTRSVWLPVLRRLRADHPALRIQLNMQLAVTPLVEHGYDLAVRAGRLSDSSLIARKFASWRHLLVASPEWVAAHPEVRTPADLLPHWLQWGRTFTAEQWRFERGEESLEIRVSDTKMVFDSAELMCGAACAGFGVMPISVYAAERELEEGKLVQLLPEWRSTHILGIYGVTAHRTMQSARVTVVLDAVRDALAEAQIRWDQWTE